MPQKMQITFAVSAVEDLEAIQAWYRQQQVPEVGEQIVEKLLRSIERLIDFPNSGRVVPEFSQRQLREIIQSRYRIVYRVGDEKVQIVRIWRSERVLKLL